MERVSGRGAGCSRNTKTRLSGRQCPGSRAVYRGISDHQVAVLGQLHEQQQSDHFTHVVIPPSDKSETDLARSALRPNDPRTIIHETREKSSGLRKNPGKNLANVRLLPYAPDFIPDFTNGQHNIIHRSNINVVSMQACGICEEHVPVSRPPLVS